jgi:hypothetical protein
MEWSETNAVDLRPLLCKASFCDQAASACRSHDPRLAELRVEARHLGVEAVKPVFNLVDLGVQLADVVGKRREAALDRFGELRDLRRFLSWHIKQYSTRRRYNWVSLVFAGGSPMRKVRGD